jgi:hypothetical protein
MTKPRTAPTFPLWGFMVTSDVRTVLAVLRLAGLRRCDGLPRRAALSPNSSSPAPNLVTRAAGTPDGQAPRVDGAAAVTGVPEPVVPLQRGVAAPRFGPNIGGHAPR